LLLAASTPAGKEDDIPEYTVPTPFPEAGHPTLAEFEKTSKELISLVIDVAALVARSCDIYAKNYVENYREGYLERVVRTSVTGKARLLHYYPPPATGSGENETDEPVKEDELDDSWCGVHVDHGCLTGLTSALYLDESLPSSELPQSREVAGQGTNLYILPRTSLSAFKDGQKSNPVAVEIPEDCLAFQTGAALEAITGGSFKAVPHFVTAPKGSGTGKKISRNTLAVFTQPNLDEIVDVEKGETFGQFAKRIVAGNY
jgi:hypothetical protein